MRLFRATIFTTASLFAFGCAEVHVENDGGGADGGRDDASCSSGARGCPCGPGSACGDGLRCEGGTCAVCPRGGLGCPCDEGACADDLVCMADRCAEPACELGAEGCPCEGGACESGLVCRAGMCAACASDTAGCPCGGGACAGGLVCDPTDTCRSPLECTDLVAMGRCAEHQVCEPARSGADASCADERCEPGYRWSAARRSCAACVSPDCSTEPSCEPDVRGSILEDCASEHRGCEVDEDGIGSCGTCEPGYGDVGGECLVGLPCGGVVCGPDEYCEGAGPGGPTCVPRPCADPSAVTLPGTTSCTIACTIDCRVAGSSGRIWPFADRAGNCVCETLPGYYLQSGADAVPVVCDADRDGWVRDAVRGPAISGPTADPTLAANMRCAIRTVGRVELRNDLGQSRFVRSCQQGLVVDPEAPCTPLPIRLLESRRNDVPGDPERGLTSGPYPAGGRAFRAEELNALTKGCVSVLGDYDDDGVPDIEQSQPTPADSSSLGEVGRLRAMAHFVELHTVHHEPPAGSEAHGTLVIAERPRCSSEFPVRYDDAAGYDALEPDTYWRSCERRRDPGFDASAGLPGFDFAQFGCDARAGSCAAAPVPAHPTTATMPDPDVALVRDHGVCELRGALPADGVWRGMNHHSQFRCAQAVAVGGASAPYDAEMSRFGPSGDLTLVACTLPGDSTARPFGSGSDPRIECEPAASVTDGAVGWAAVRYRAYGHRVGTTPEGTPVGWPSYLGGCVNEDAEWPALCPAPEFERCASPPMDAFGRYRCFGEASSFLWAADDETAASFRRASLVYTEEAPAFAPNMSVWNGVSSICR